MEGTRVGRAAAPMSLPSTLVAFIIHVAEEALLFVLVLEFSEYRYGRIA